MSSRRALRSALLLAVAFCGLALAPAVAAQELLANGGFEAGAAGWTTTDAFVNAPSGAPTRISAATTGPLSGLPVPGPNAGTSYGLFDASGPATQALVQGFTVPAGTKTIAVGFALAIGDWSGVGPVDAGGLDHTLPVNQNFRVDILTAGASAFDTSTGVVVNLLAAAGVPFTSYANQVHDLTNVVLPGATYQLRFASVHNQGYLTAGVDDVSVFASPALCADGVVDPGEECDDAGESATCDANCTFVVCGDGTPNATAGESCDDGDANDNDDCTNACQNPACGDGIPWTQGAGTEQCDDGDTSNNNDCTNACENPACGDGIPWFLGAGTEECDDGNANENDDCTSACEDAKCGDGIAWNSGLGTEACDDGDGIDNNDCTNACTLAICGDGVLFSLGSGTERCDDGGTVDGDGCSATCEPEPSLLPLLTGPMGWVLALLLLAVAAAFLRREHARAESRRARAALWVLLAFALAQLPSRAAHAADFAINVVEDVLELCQPDYGAVTVHVSTTGETAVTLSVPSAPTGLVRHATPTTLDTLPGSSILALGATGVPALGSSVVTVVGSGASGLSADAFTLNLLPVAPAPPTLLSPADGATNVALAPTLTWSAAAYASSFAVEVASDASFSNIVHSAVVLTNSATVPALAPGATYSWRVRSENACGAGAFSQGRSFTTTVTVCDTYESGDVPKTISTTGTVTSTLTVSGAQPAITDVNVTLLGTHARVGDLVVSLESPEATSVAIADFSSCTNGSDFDLSLDDAASLPIPCPPTGAGAHLPTNPLVAYASEDPNGTWTLSVVDSVAANGGQLDGFGVEICAGPALPAIIDLAPASLTSAQPTDSVVVKLLDVGNIGTLDLTWTLDEEPAASIAAARAAAVTQQMQTAIDALADDAGGAVRVARQRSSGAARFVGFERTQPLALAGATRRSKAQSFFARHGQSFGLRDAASELVETSDRRDRRGFTHVEFEQRFGGLPVFGGGLRLHFDPSDRLSAANGRLTLDIAVDTNAKIDASEAGRIARQIVLAQQTSDGSAKRRSRQRLQFPDLAVNDVELMIFRAGLLQHETGRVHLAYRVEVGGGTQLREIIFVDAHSGKLVERHSGVHEALFRRLYETNLSNQIWVEGSPFPGSLNVWQQTEIVAAAHTYRFFNNVFGHTSYDDADAEMRTVNNDPTILCPNANWNGVTANYCNGTAADDVVAHEWGHAYTEYTSELIYAWQTGALNESYSDIWGETIDLINGYQDAGENLSVRAACGDTQRWMMGEDATAFGGALRDMWNPNCNGDPAKVSDGQYWCTSADFGGVHTNSGVPNRLYTLLVDGGTFNGQSISALGFTKAAHIHFRAQSVYEMNTTDFEDHADSLEQACSDLIGVNLETLTTGSPAGPSGQVITTTDCAELADAIVAVELRTPSCPGAFTPMLAKNAPPLCGGGSVDSILSADFEAGLGGFSVGQVPVNPGTWDARTFAIAGALPDGRAGSAAYGIDPVVGDCQSDLDNGVIYLQSPPIVVPGDATAPVLLAFDHYASLEQDWDGGNLKYSTNGTTWNVVPSSAFTFNPYNGTLNTVGAGNDNPMAGQAAFTGADDGTISGSWGQSQIDLSVVGVDPGDTVYLRFELGTDGCNGWDGWYVDDVEVYGCSSTCTNPSDVPWLSAAPIAGVTSPAGATSVDVTFDSTGLADGSYAASLCVSSNDPVTPVVALPVTLDVATP